MSQCDKNKLQTMEQRRAQYALREIEPLQKKDEKTQKELRGLLHSLPALIHMNGLGQALAFCCMKDKGKKDSAHWLAYEMIGGWLHQQGILGERDALRAIAAGDMPHYMAATTEAQALLQWLKKFATAYLKSDD